METIHEIIYVLSWLAAVGFLVCITFAWVLAPLSRAAKSRQGIFQFSLADFLCLFVLIQLPFGAVYGMANEYSKREVVVGFSLLIAAVAVVAWLAGVQLLSKANIRVPWHRGVALGVVMPITVFGNFALIGMPIAAMSALDSGRSSQAFWLFVAETLVAGAVYACGRFTRMIVACAENKKETRDDEGPRI
jgi:hypothetical protein